MKLIIDIPDETYYSLCVDYIFAPPIRSGKTIISILQNCIATGTPLKEWLSSFNTDSAPICFNKIQDLKRECEKENE